MGFGGSKFPPFLLAFGIQIHTFNYNCIVDVKQMLMLFLPSPQQPECSCHALISALQTPLAYPCLPSSSLQVVFPHSPPDFRDRRHKGI